MGRVYLSKAVIVFSLFIALSFLHVGCQPPASPPDPADPPVAIAGANQTVSGGSTVTLDGSASVSPSGDTLTYSWVQTGGTPVMLSGANTATPTFTAPKESATLVFELTVTDSSGQTATDTVVITVTITLQPPVANAGENQSVTGGDQVTLNGSKSTSPNGGALSYAWVQTGGTPVILMGANTAQATFTAPNQTQVLTFQLTVTDSQGLSDTATVTVSVTSKAQPPIASAGPDQNVTGGDLVLLDGSASTDPNGVPLAFSWVQVSGTAVVLKRADTAKPVFIAPNVTETLVFKLTVTNSLKLSSSATVKIYVTATSQNLPPVADAGQNQSVLGGTLVTLDGSGSSDSNGDLLTYSWVQLKGTQAVLVGANLVRAKFIAPNVTDTLVFELTVRDSQGLSSSATVNIVVTARAENLPPVANAGMDISVSGNVLVLLDGSKSFDPEGKPLTYSWTQIAGVKVVLTNPTSVNPTFVAPNVTTILAFQLIVNDGKLSSVASIVHVSVTATGNQPPVADAGPDEYVVGGSIVTLNGAGSRDPDGGLLTYFWSQTQGTPVLLTGGNTAKPTFVAPNKNDVLVFLLTVTDPQGLTSQDAVAISVTATAGDLPPVCNPGPPQCVKFGAVVILDGSASVDPEGGSLSFAWVQISGTVVVLGGADTPTPTFLAPSVSATLVFQLTVTDSRGFSATATVTIRVSNTVPTANAGPDQTVSPGAFVQLDGSASSDPGGGPLTFTWVQISGTEVVLQGANTAKPTFTAPGIAATLTFRLTVTDKLGCASSDTVTIIVRAGQAVLFVANSLGNNITGFRNLPSAAGDVSPFINLAGQATLLSGPRDVALTAGGSLIVCNFVSASLTIYNDALSANDNQSPDRVVTGSLTQLINPAKLAMDRSRDVLYVMNKFSSTTILVFADVSRLEFNGDVPPVRTITISPDCGCTQIDDIAFAGPDTLYLLDCANNRILAIDHVSTKNGEVMPSREIASSAFTNLIDLTVDTNDNLIVINGANTVLIFSGAVSRKGVVVPTREFSVSDSLSLSVVITDHQGTGYFSDFFNNAIYELDHLVTLTGPVTPDRILKGANTQLNGPYGMAILE